MQLWPSGNWTHDLVIASSKSKTLPLLHCTTCVGVPVLLWLRHVMLISTWMLVTLGCRTQRQCLDECFSDLSHRTAANTSWMLSRSIYIIPLTLVPSLVLPCVVAATCPYNLGPYPQLLQFQKKNCNTSLQVSGSDVGPRKPMFEGPCPTLDKLPQAYISVWLAVLLLCYRYNLQDEILICRMHSVVL